MTTPLNKVRAFHTAFGQELDAKLDPELLKFRLNLIEEEYDEFQEAVGYLHQALIQRVPGGPKALLEHAVKEACDLIYTVYGFAATFGIDLDEAFTRVHLSNMSKLGPEGRALKTKAGKAIKGPNYQEPDLIDLVDNAS